MSKENQVAKSEAQVKKDLDEIKSLKTVSAQIRALDSKGYSRSEIAKMLGKRYQHVRNVLTTPLKKKS